MNIAMKILYYCSDNDVVNFISILQEGDELRFLNRGK